MARLDMDSNLQFEASDLNTLLQGVVEEFQLQVAKEGPELTLKKPKGETRVNADFYRIRQVLQNLIGNAVKYTSPGGQVEISTEKQDGEIWVIIRDNGLGIPEEDLPHIFDKFYRVNASDRAEIQGSGLGLSIVKAIVEMHHGKIEVESTLGEGSCFRFSLPLAVDERVASTVV
jgi:signal transduction histidine kinase